MFTLPEEFLLLSIHESKGTFFGSLQEHLKIGLGSAILAELALLGKIQANASHRLQVVEHSPVQDEILDRVLGMLKEAEKERKYGYWINVLAQKAGKLQEKITESLVQKGILTLDDEHLNWVIPSPLQPEVKASTKYLINKRLRGMVLAQENFEKRDLVLLSLVNACGFLDLVFLRDERKLAAAYINELLYGQAITDLAIQTVQEIVAALATAVEID